MPLIQKIAILSPITCNTKTGIQLQYLVNIIQEFLHHVNIGP